MKIIYNNVIPPKGFSAINLFGVLFVRKGIAVTERLVDHEQIHTAQMKELLYIFFYIWYILEWLVKLVRYGKQSYYNISFEREAYSKDCDPNYLKNRKPFSFIKYLWTKNN
jgi:hypothetical protein